MHCNALSITSATLYIIWRKTLRFIENILHFCKRILYFIAKMSKVFSENDFYLKTF